MRSKGERNQPVSMVAHDVVNKLSAIVGNCDLLNEITEGGTEYAKRVATIRGLAEAAAKELKDHQRNLETETRKAG